MTNLKYLSDDQLHSQIINTSERERAVTLELLKELNEVERRHLYSKYSCSSLHAYCVKHLKMSDPQAARRVNASRLLKEVPVIEEKILDGTMTLTSVSQAATFFKQEARSGQKFEASEKLEVLTQLESKSTREVEQILVSKSASPEIHLKDRVKAKTENLNEVRLHFDNETIEMLEKLKSLWSHAMPNASYSDLFKRMIEESMRRHDPIKKAERSHKTGKSWIKHQVRFRDQNRCTFVDPRTGERCNSEHFLEEDHIQPKALGGEYTTENIRLRCRAHNQRHAINVYGLTKMQQHLRGR